MPTGLTRCRLRTVTVMVLAAIAQGCAATQPVRVLAEGERRWISSIGGPVLPEHTPTKFIPYTNVGMMWGVSGAPTVSANMHLLAAAFGVAGADVGVAHRLRSQDGAIPEITAQGQLYGFVGRGGARAYPNVTGTASWAAGRRTLLYGGSALTVGTLRGKTVLVTPLVGVQRDVSRRLTMQLESKWMAANIDMSSGLFEGESSVNGHGGLAVQIGVQVKR